MSDALVPPPASAASGPRLLFGDFCLDTRQRELTRGEQVLALTPKQFDVLEHLVLHAGQVVTKQELMAAVWPDSHVQESNLSQNVFWLRRALRDDEEEDSQRYIVTVSGRGYRFVAAVTEEGHAAAPPSPESPAAPAPLPTAPAPRVPSGLKRWSWAAAVFLGVVVTAGFVWRSHRHKAAYQPSVSPEVLVAQVQNGTSDPSLTAVLNGILRRGIAQSPVIYVVPRSEIRKTLGYMQLPLDTAVTATTGREICIRRNATAIVETAILPAGSGYTVTLEARNCVTGKTISSASATAPRSDDVLVALDGMIPGLRRDLGESPTSLRQFSVPVENATTSSLEAFKAFLEAEDLRMKGETVKAVPLYQRALALDGNFALAHLALATCYQTTEEREAGVAEFRRAYELAGRISPRERLYVEYFYVKQVLGDLPASIPLNADWERLYPRDPAPWTNGTDTFNQLDRFEEAIRHGERGLILFPEGGLIYVALGQAYLRAGRYDDMLRIGRQAVGLKVDGWQLHELLWQRATLANDAAAASQERSWANGTADEYLAVADDELLALQRGRIEPAMELQRRLQQLAMAQHARSAVDENRGRTALALEEMGLLEAAHAQVDAWKPAFPTPEIGLALAMLGEDAKARDVLRGVVKDHEKDTLVTQWRAPLIEAALALHEGSSQGAQKALAALEKTRPLDLHDMTASYLRGKALLLLHHDAEAEREFRHIVESPGAEPFSPLMTLAYLQLARARHAAGDLNGSAQAYEAALHRWEQSSPEAPAVQTARRELSELHASQH